ncbi:hypothetical protein O988_04328 [Pseudogymnoascus sp. VKM F-3808]|nr:hypothetical protein O988_04328 [Pseudogymnoascus sp. VKM F-3808]
MRLHTIITDPAMMSARRPPNMTRLADRGDDDQDPCGDVDGAVAGVLEAAPEEEAGVAGEVGVILYSAFLAFAGRAGGAGAGVGMTTPAVKFITKPEGRGAEAVKNVEWLFPGIFEN